VEWTHATVQTSEKALIFDQNAICPI
jgi:hypothetical protein